MKHVKLLFAVCIMAVALSSCYSSRVLNGNVTDSDPVIKVNAKKNHFLLYGLIPLGKAQQASDYVGKRTNYVARTSWTFVDGFLNWLTCGVYTPTTTTYYVPLDEIKK